jgi:hypothetical protein
VETLEDPFAGLLGGSHLRRDVWRRTDSPRFRRECRTSALEKVLARTIRNLSIPARARNEKNPWKPTPENLQEARDRFLAQCAICHATDGSGVTQFGRDLYPNPCTSCHPDRSTAWALEALRHWPEHSPWRVD